MTLTSNNYSGMIAGGAGNAGACNQITSTDGEVTIANYAYAIVAVNGDATFTTLEESGSGSKLASKTLYQNCVWTGYFTKIEVASGEVTYWEV